MARAAKTGAGYDEQIKILCLFTEGNVIRNQRPREQIEGTLWLHHMIAHAAQTVYQQIFIRFIDGDVCGFVCTLCTHSLEEARCVDVAKTSACACHSGIDEIGICHAVRNEYVAQTFTR